MEWIANIDRRINDACYQRLSSSRMQPVARVMLAASRTGSFGAIWIAGFAIVALTVAEPLEAVIAGASVVIALGVNSLIKLIVGRARPTKVIGHPPGSSSFPSAHTTMAVVGAATISTLAPALAVIAWTWAGILGISRFVLGAHWLSDVIAGAALGSVLAYFAVEALAALS